MCFKTNIYIQKLGKNFSPEISSLHRISWRQTKTPRAEKRFFGLKTCKKDRF